MYPVPTASNPMGGKASVAINNVEIPSFMLGEITPNVAPELRTSERLSGTSTRPSGNLDNPSYDIVFFPNNWADLGFFLPSDYNVPSGSQTLGNFILGGGTCVAQSPVPVNIHYECEGTDDRDTYMAQALIAIELNQAYTGTDDMSVLIHVYPQANAGGQIRLGTGDLTQPSIYNPITEETDPVTS